MFAPTSMTACGIVKRELREFLDHVFLTVMHELFPDLPTLAKTTMSLITSESTATSFAVYSAIPSFEWGKVETTATLKRFTQLEFYVTL